MYSIFYESDYSLCKVSWNVTLCNVNTLLHAYKQIIMSMRQVHTKWHCTQSFWYMCFLHVSGICVFLVRHNTTKLCAISLNTRARLHTMSYIKQATYKDNVARKYTRTNNLQGYSTLSPGPMGWAYTQDYQQYPKLPCLRVSRVLSRVPRT